MTIDVEVVEGIPYPDWLQVGIEINEDVAKRSDGIP